MHLYPKDCVLYRHPGSTPNDIFFRVGSWPNAFPTANPFRGQNYLDLVLGGVWGSKGVEASGRVGTWYQAYRYNPIYYCWITSRDLCLIFPSLFFFHTHLVQHLDKPWSREESSLLPPGSCLQFLIARTRVQQSHCSSIFHRVLPWLKYTPGRAYISVAPVAYQLYYP